MDKEDPGINPDALAARRDRHASDPDVQQRLWYRVYRDHRNDEAPQTIVLDRASVARLAGYGAGVSVEVREQITNPFAPRVSAT